MMNSTEVIEVFEASPWLAYGACILVVLLLFFVFVLLRRRQPKSVLAYSTENGDVRVHRSAIVELVRTSCEQLEGVSRPNVTIRVKNRLIHFEVRIKLAGGGHLKTVEQTLQTHLRKALSENLGIEDLGRIHVIATGFQSGRIEAEAERGTGNSAAGSGAAEGATKPLPGASRPGGDSGGVDSR